MALVLGVGVRSHSGSSGGGSCLGVNVRSHSGSSGGSRRGGKCKVPLWK